MARRGSLAVFFTLLSGTAFASGEMVSVPADAPADAWEISCEAMPLPETPNNAFTAPESFHYAVHWGVLTAGRGQINVGPADPLQGRPAHRLTMTLETTGLTHALHAYSEKTITWIDQASLMPWRYRKETREGHYARDEDVMFDPTCRRLDRVEHRLDKGTVERKQARLPGPALDILGYLFYIRTLPLAVGQHYDLTLVSGDHLWPVTVAVKDKVKISTAAGRFECFFVEPTLRATADPDVKLRELQVWLTADARKIPVRLRMEANVGHITAELTAYRDSPD